MSLSPLSSFKILEVALLDMSLCVAFSGLFDQIIHSVENVDMLGLLNHLHSKVYSLRCQQAAPNVDEKLSK